MKSFAITEYSKPLECIEAEPPVPQGAEILLRVKAAGVCHTDIHIWEGGYDLGGGRQLKMADRGQTLPHTMGHETVGEIVSLGPEADGVELGDVRLIYPWIGCGTCPICASDTEQLCPSPRYLGVFRPGGYAEYILVPHPRYLISIGALSPEQAAPYSCSGLTAFSAIKKLGGRVAEVPTLVIGAGGVGLQCLALMKAMGGLKAVVADLDEGKRAAAIAAGAAVAIDPSADDAAAQITRAMDGPVWSIIDFVGAPSSWALANQVIAKGGIYVIVGLYGGETQLSIATIPLRATSILGSFVGSRPELIELMDLVAGGKVSPLPVTCRPLEESFDALMDLKNGKVIGRTILAPGPADD